MFPHRNYRLTIGTSQHFHTDANVASQKTSRDKSAVAEMLILNCGERSRFESWTQAGQRPSKLCPWFCFEPTPGSASHQSPKVIQQWREGNQRGREGERDEREKEREGEDRKGQVFQLSLQHLSDPSGSGGVLSRKPNKFLSPVSYVSCKFIFVFILSLLSASFLLPADRETTGNVSHIPVTFIQG